MTTHGVIRLGDYRDSWLILFSHPADFTPVCTTEFIAFTKIYPELQKRHVELLGLSIDSVYSHIAWVRNIEENGGLCQALLGGLAEHYGSRALMLRFAGPTVGASAGALGLLAAYATLFPERPLTFLLFLIIPISMRAKFLLLISALLAVLGLVFPVGNMADAAHLGGMGTGVLFIRYAAEWDWHWPRWRRRRGHGQALLRVGSKGARAWGGTRNAADEDLPPEEFLRKEVDPILDKISAQGLHSLTPRERRILEAAGEKIGRR